ncbi:MAG TPA: hypothetical protein PLF88_14330 [Opitutaceae bacterium]|nr:hypothetical protein [Opitutaceae bacterium]
MRCLTILWLLVLAGCATPAQRATDTEARAHERGIRQAVKEHYWQLQERQRQSSTPSP